MEMSPQRVRGAEFKTVRKGADLDEVRAFLNDVADELERAQNQSTAMEARARAAVARLQEVGEGTAPTAAAAATPAVEASVDESETISRTLLLAQRTADTTVAEAKREADGILKSARDEAATTRDSTREMASQMLDEARVGARQAGEAERLAIAGEVDALKARRDFLESDVEQLEIFLADQRNRVREAATSLLDVADRVPGGLGEVRTPLLSASHDDDTADTEVATDDDVGQQIDVDDDVEENPRPSPVDTLDDVDDAPDDDDDQSLLIVTDLAENDPDASPSTEPSSGPSTGPTDATNSIDDDPWNDRDRRDEPTAAMPIVESARSTSDDSDGFRFSFDDDDDR